ncbi:MAG: hypothetical protein AAGH83_05405 [Pseudomonadota bacterium]
MDPNDPQPPAVPAKADRLALITYGLYIVGAVFSPLAIVGLIIAYRQRGENRPLLHSHYTFLIRTFWIALLGIAIALLMTGMGIGFLLYVVVVVWYLIRAIKGIVWLKDGKPIENPQTWFM